MSKPRKYFCEMEGLRRREYGRMYSKTVSRRYTHRGTCCESNTFMAPEYGSTSQKDTITPFSTSSAIVGPNLESRT